MAEVMEKKTTKESNKVSKDIALEAFRLMCEAKALTELYEENKGT